jgi:hypothetical protein
MSVVPPARALFAALCLCATIFGQAPVVVYETSTNYSGKYHQSTNEYGDEIILFGSKRVVTQIQIEYFASFVPSGDELARVRFYENTGPGWKGSDQYRTPASPPLWEATFPVGIGYNTATITVPNVKVPLRLTWTVQFFGIAMDATERAGLLIYGDPIVGSSFNDFWELRPVVGWDIVRFSDVPKNNFAARILAVDEAPAAPGLSFNVSGGNLIVSWPATATGLYLESRPGVDSGVWAPVYPQGLQVGNVFQASIPMSEAARIFRLNSQPQTPLTVIASAENVRVRWSAAVGGQKLQTKASLQDTAWVDLPTPTRPSGDYYEAILAATNNTAFFRLSKTF